MEEKNSRSELIWMLKHGRAGEALERMHLDRHEAYPGGFVQFMDRMLEEHHLTRKEVAVRAGMSQDYTYKLLRGDKHTDNRDYILAICVAAGLTTEQEWVRTKKVADWKKLPPAELEAALNKIPAIFLLYRG